MKLFAPVVVLLYVSAVVCWWPGVHSKQVQICLVRSHSDPKTSMLIEAINKTVENVVHHASRTMEFGVSSVWVDLHDIYNRCTGSNCGSKLNNCSVVVAVASCKSVTIHQLLLSNTTSSPSLVFTEGLCDAGSTVALLPWTCRLTSVVSGVLSHLKWTNVLFISDDFMPHQQNLLLRALTHLHVGVVHVQIKGGQSELLSDLAARIPPDVHSIIMCVGPVTALIVIKEAKRLGMLGANFDWLSACSFGLEPTSMLPLMAVDSRLTLLRPTHKTTNSSTLNYESGCDQYDAGEVTESRILRNLSKYVPEISALYNFTSYLDDEKQSTGSTDTCKGDFELCSFTSHNGRSFKRVGTWLNGGGWQVHRPGDIFANDFKDFGNRTLTIGTIPASPFVFRKTAKNRTVYTGFCLDLLDVLASQLNFQYKIVESPDGKYGAPEGNDSWNGMVGMVARGEADMGVGPYTITSIRETVIDFSVPYMEDGGGILTKKGDSAAASVTGLSTFDVTVWLTLLATVVAVSVTFYVVVKFSPSSVVPTAEDKAGHWSATSCVLHICGSLMMQGMERHPKSLSARCLLGCWWVFAILIVSTYTATLTSVLTVDVQGDKVDSIEDLVQSQVEPLVLAGTLWETMFQTATEGIYIKVAERMRDMPEVTSEEVAVQHVLTGNMAFLHDINNLQYLYSQDCKRLHLAAKLFQSNGFGIIMPENAPYKDAVNNIILRLQEGGLLDKWRSYWWPMTKCGPQVAASVSQGQELGVSKISGLLILYMGVVALASLCFATVVCVRRSRLAGVGDSSCRRLSARRVTETTPPPLPTPPADLSAG